MKRLKTFIVALLLSFTPFAVAQTAQPGLALSSITGLPATLNANVIGTAGTTVSYYVLMTNFVGGSVPSNIVTVNNTPGTLSSTDYVSFIWTPVSGVVTYDLLKLTSNALPSGSNSVLLHGGLAATVTSSVDKGTSITSYTIGALPPSPIGLIQVNSRDYNRPQYDFSTFSGTSIAGFAINSVPLPVVNNDISASATGITLSTAQVINAIFTHSPAGAVADTTPTATAIIAALPSCYVSGTVASTFLFTLLNTAAGANAITLTGGTNVTIVGTAAVPQNFAGNFRGVVTACTGTPAVKLYSLGQTAF